jgi:hypothetical protein
MHRSFGFFALVGLLTACQPQLPFVGGEESATQAEAEPAPGTPHEAPGAERSAGAARSASEIDLQALTRRPRGQESICRTFARTIAEAATQHGDDVDAFMADLRQEFIGGADNPFEMKKGLQQGRWNQRYFYGGHGGFRPEYDDADRYPRRGNHQPGHFISVLSIAQQFGEEQARIAIAAAGDYEPGDEDDLRLSMVAIPLGAGLRDGSVTPAEVAQRARGLCRS